MTLIPSTQELCRCLRVQGQPYLHCEVQGSQGYKVRPCLRNLVNEIKVLRLDRSQQTTCILRSRSLLTSNTFPHFIIAFLHLVVSPRVYGDNSSSSVEEETKHPPLLANKTDVNFLISFVCYRDYISQYTWQVSLEQDIHSFCVRKYLVINSFQGKESHLLVALIIFTLILSQPDYFKPPEYDRPV